MPDIVNVPPKPQIFAEVVALRTSGLVNTEMTLREITAAAMKIPGIGDGSPVAWELITRDFAYKGDVVNPGVAKSQAINAKAIAALQDSKILDFGMSLGTIIDIAKTIPGFGDSGNPAAWELVSRDFVLRG